MGMSKAELKAKLVALMEPDRSVAKAWSEAMLLAIQTNNVGKAREALETRGADIGALVQTIAKQIRTTKTGRTRTCTLRNCRMGQPGVEGISIFHRSIIFHRSRSSPQPNMTRQERFGEWPRLTYTMN